MFEADDERKENVSLRGGTRGLLIPFSTVIKNPPESGWTGCYFTCMLPGCMSLARFVRPAFFGYRQVSASFVRRLYTVPGRVGARNADLASPKGLGLGRGRPH
jgi:hypothetical protein